MKKGYWVVAYRSISHESAVKAYGELAVLAVQSRNWNRDVDYYNRFSGADESETNRQGFCHNEIALSVVVSFGA